MNEISELKTQVKNLERTVAQLNRKIEFLLGMVDTQLQVAALGHEAHSRAFDDIDSADPVWRPYLYAGSMGPRAVGAAVHTFATRSRQPIRRDGFSQGRALVFKTLGKASEKFALEPSAEPGEISGGA